MPDDRPTLFDRYEIEAASQGIPVADLSRDDRQRIAEEFFADQFPGFELIGPASGAPIVVTEYDNSWPRIFDAWRRRLSEKRRFGSNTLAPPPCRDWRRSRSSTFRSWCATSRTKRRTSPPSNRRAFPFAHDTMPKMSNGDLSEGFCFWCDKTKSLTDHHWCNAVEGVEDRVSNELRLGKDSWPPNYVEFLMLSKTSGRVNKQKYLSYPPEDPMTDDQLKTAKDALARMKVSLSCSKAPLG